MKATKEHTAAAAREVKRLIEIPLMEAQKIEKVIAEAKRRRKIQRAADEKCERLRAKAERRSVVGVEGLEFEATRKSCCAFILIATRGVVVHGS